MGVKRTEGLAGVPRRSWPALSPSFRAGARWLPAEDILRRRMTLKATSKRFILP